MPNDRERLGRDAGLYSQVRELIKPYGEAHMFTKKMISEKRNGNRVTLNPFYLSYWREKSLESSWRIYLKVNEKFF